MSGQQGYFWNSFSTWTESRKFVFSIRKSGCGVVSVWLEGHLETRTYHQVWL